MSARIKVDGIYDKRTILSLMENGVYDLGFDFRPKSFNFLQQHAFLELIRNTSSSKFQYFLRYEDEQDFIIKKMIDDVRSSSLDIINKCILEFLDKKPAEFYDQFELPFFWHYSPEVPLKDILECKNIKGIILDYNFLEELRDQGSFNNFIQNFFQIAYEKIEKDSIQLVLNLDWDANIFPSLFDFMDFDQLALPINNKIEVCYRNVDLNKVKINLGHYQGLQV